MYATRQESRFRTGKQQRYRLCHTTKGRLCYPVEPRRYTPPICHRRNGKRQRWQVGVIPLHLNATGEKLDEMFRISLNHADGQLLSDLLVGKSLKETYKAGEICAACWMLPVSVVQTIGGFNPLYFHYGEDNNFYQRMVYHHIPMLLVPKSRMYHDRVFYGNQVAHHHKRTHRDMLNIVCDINLSLSKRMFEVARAIVRAYAYDLPIKSYRPGGFLKELLWCACNLSRIRHSRLEEKKTGLTWL